MEYNNPRGWIMCNVVTIYSSLEEEVWNYFDELFRGLKRIGHNGPTGPL